MRILYFVDRLLRGGIQTLLLNLISQMKKEQDVFVDLLVFDDNQHYELEDTFKNMNISVYKVTWPTLKGFIRCCHELDAFFRVHNKYDIVHAHTSSKAVLPLYYAKKHGMNIRIAHSHNTDFQTKNVLLKMIGSFLKVPLRSLTTHYFACSEVAGIWLFGKRLVDEGKVCILKNGIIVDDYVYNSVKRDEIRQKFSISNNEVIIGNVGRFSNQKNHSFLVDIFYSYHALNKNSKLILVGSGELMDNIKSKVERMSLSDSVIFAGFHANVQDFYQVFDVFLMPSLYEGLPFVGIEAQASGLPCFFSDTITQELKIIDSVYYLSVNDKPEMWAAKIDSCLRTFERVDTKNSITKAGYNIENETKKLLTYYKSII